MLYLSVETNNQLFFINFILPCVISSTHDCTILLYTFYTIQINLPKRCNMVGIIKTYLITAALYQCNQCFQFIVFSQSNI